MRLKNKTRLNIVAGFLIFINMAPFVFAENPRVLTKDENYSSDLYFQSVWKDFLVFYETKGSEKNLYYLRFRIDRWDYNNDERVNELVPGEEYTVEFVFLDYAESERDLAGVKVSGRLTPKGVSRQVRVNRPIISGRYSAHKPLRIKNIRY